MEYKLRLDLNAHAHYYAFTSWYIALAKAPTKRNGIINPISTFNSCREGMCMDMARALRANIEERDYWKGIGQLATADRYNTHLVVFSKIGQRGLNGPIEAREKELGKAIMVINSLEKNAGWPLTKAFRIKRNHQNGSFDPREIYYYIKGSRKWHRAPSLLSLYGILLRAGRLAPVKGEIIKGADKDAFLKLQKRVREYKNPHRSYLSTALCYGLPFLQKIDTIFKNRTIAYNYGKQRLKNGPGYVNISIEGFQMLVGGSTRDKVLREVVRKHVVSDVKKERALHNN